MNAARGSGKLQFVEFGFRVTPFASEIAIELAAKPDPVDTYKQMIGSRKSLINKQGDARRWEQKRATAEAQLASANRMPERNDFERKANGTKINQSTLNIQRAAARLKVLAVEIPAQQNVVATTEAHWAAIAAQLEPIRSCTITGEFWRRIGDVRIPVLRLVEVKDQVAAE